MIISDSHKFIFFHVPKSAGTSISCKLARYSNNKKLFSPNYKLYIDDIMSDPTNNPDKLQKIVENIPKDCMSNWYQKYPEKIASINLPHYMLDPHRILVGWESKRYRTPNAEHRHLEDNAGKFHEYCKFVVVRNSWDYVFSIFKNKIVVDQVAKEWDESMDWGEMVEQRINKPAFLNFMHNIQEDHWNIFNNYFYNRSFDLCLNQQVYFCNREMQSYANHILSFDCLDQGLEQVSEKIGINLKRIPKRNVSGKKKNKNNYVNFYDNKSRKLVKDIFKLDIDRFNFKFGE